MDFPVRREPAALQNLPSEALGPKTLTPYDGSLSADSATFHPDLNQPCANRASTTKRTSTFLSPGKAMDLYGNYWAVLSAAKGRSTERQLEMDFAT
jgi:hypothetical protein